MVLKSPYYKSHLIKGFINAPKSSLRWHDENVGLIKKHTVFGGLTLCNNISTLIKCYRCKNCNKIIIDLNELEKWE